tara:strand:- start:163 stop:327 length:165 start_codon:yes stop_codon:yes gene_type:complete
MSLPLIISCFLLALILLVFPLIISKKAQENSKKSKDEWQKIKEYGNKINKQRRK